MNFYIRYAGNGQLHEADAFRLAIAQAEVWIMTDAISSAVLPAPVSRFIKPLGWLHRIRQFAATKDESSA